MYNDFVILGPAEDPAGIAKIKDPVLAFSKIYQHKQTFISRGDHSGTHQKEKHIWEKVDLNPNTNENSWYLESGQGMAATLRIADEKNSYVLLDRATYLFNKDKLRLKLLVKGNKILLNPYGIIAVSPYKHPHVQYQLSMALIAWITSPECQEIIAGFKVNGSVLFKKNANHEMDTQTE